MKQKYDILIANNKPKAEELVERLEGKSPVFICTIATTETAKIPGVSAAGKNPEITDYTPPADVELLFYGRCKCIEGVPVTPEGIPTPALITMSALKLADIPLFVVSGGLKVKPHAPFLDLGGEPGEDIRTGKSVRNVEEIIQRAKLAGENFAKIADYLVIGESIPGGTTTTLGILLAMGIDAKGKISSSMPTNPHEIKNQAVEKGMHSAKIKFGDLKNDPITAISKLGDPMVPAFAGLALGAAEKVPVLLSGGTQMSAVLAVIKTMNPKILDFIAIGTTRWIIQDGMADMRGIITQIADIPILAANLDFTNSRYDGLKVYEKGFVKEGVGAGGSTIAAIIKSQGTIDKQILLDEIERNYARLIRS